MSDANEYVGLKEAARMLGCHMNTVRRIPVDELPYWRLGHRGDRRYHVSHVLTYIAKRQEPAAVTLFGKPRP